MDLSAAQEAATALPPDGEEPVPAKALQVCVVGAGISGLRCASELLACGVQVTIIEARDRIGGRICQSDELGYAVDLGPNWIHTSGSNPILDLANLTSTPLHIWNEKVQVFDHDGKTVDGKTVKGLSELRWDMIEEAMRYSKENIHSIDKNDSLGRWFEKKAAEMDIAEYDRKVLIGMAEMWGCYIGDSIYQQSLKYTWLEDCCGGGKYPVRETRIQPLRLPRRIDRRKQLCCDPCRSSASPLGICQFVVKSRSRPCHKLRG